MLLDSSNRLIARILALFQRDLALENDYLRQENKILRSKFGARVPLTEAERKILVRFGLKIKDRLHEIASIASLFSHTLMSLGPPTSLPKRSERGVGW